LANDKDERTEEATPKRREEERDKGHIAKSQDFTSALVLTSGLAFLYIQGSDMIDKIMAMLKQSFSNLHPDLISSSDAISVLSPYLYHYFNIVFLFFIFLFLAAILVLRLQTGALFAKEALKPRFDKLSPSNAMKQLVEKFNIFKPRQMVEFIKSILKLIIVCLIGVKTIINNQNDLMGLIGAEPSVGFVVIGTILMKILINICIFLVIIGFLDRKYQEYEYNKSIKMTKQEVKEERKNIDGDPKIKGKIRSFQMKIMQQQMMAKVKDATVVVVNPTHFAVALMFDPPKTPAPVVVAKGVDFVAFKIREVAKNNGVPIVENKPLARSLYKLVDLNQFIPEELYVAVAEILQFVMNKKQ